MAQNRELSGKRIVVLLLAIFLSAAIIIASVSIISLWLRKPFSKRLANVSIKQEKAALQYPTDRTQDPPKPKDQQAINAYTPQMAVTVEQGPRDRRGPRCPLENARTTMPRMSNGTSPCRRLPWAGGPSPQTLPPTILWFLCWKRLFLPQIMMAGRCHSSSHRSSLPQPTGT